jgi:aminoglycoside phosphotransferase (APT) family kinase protein
MGQMHPAAQVDEASMAERLLLALQGGAIDAASARITALQRLSGGANMETWSFDLSTADHTEQLILRRVPGRDSTGEQVTGFAQRELSLATEAQLLVVAGRHNVPVPSLRVVLEPQYSLGEGYVMSREAGEALPFRLLADECYARAREKLAFQCGQTLALIHRIPLSALPADLPDYSGARLWQRAQALLDHYDNASPVLQLAINWLRDHARPMPQRTLVHGDFRNGNLLVAEQGLVAVLDWELAHLGDPLQDLGYITANVWRFGAPKPVGGFGEYDELLAGYASVSGITPSLRDIHYWQVHAALHWGLVCLLMLGMYRSGQDPSLERAAIGRRLSEAEIDVLLLLEREFG